METSKMGSGAQRSRKLILAEPRQAMERIAGCGEFVWAVEGNQAILDQLNDETAQQLISEFCKEICLFGNDAEQWHDKIDEILEEHHCHHIITTWQSRDDIEEFAFYFACVAGNRPINLLLTVGKQLESILARAFEDCEK